MYKATITYSQDNYQHKIYYGISKAKIKQRYTNHITSFSYENHQSDTELSNKLCCIKNNNCAPNVAQKIIQKHQTYNLNTKICSFEGNTGNSKI